MSIVKGTKVDNSLTLGLEFLVWIVAIEEAADEKSKADGTCPVDCLGIGECP